MKIAVQEAPASPLPVSYRPTDLEEVSHLGTGLRFITRIRSYDRGTVRENLSNKCYLQYIELSKTDRWMDAGGHIGIFSTSIAHAVEAVYAYEPFPGSYSLLRRNLDLNQIHNVYPNNVALTHDASETLQLNLNPRGSHGVHSVLPLHGRRPMEVPAVNIDDEIISRRITSIKMDVEGAEALLLPGISDASWKQVDQIVLEYHFWYLKDYAYTTYLSLIDLLGHYFKSVKSSFSDDSLPKEAPKTCILYARKADIL